MLRTQHFFAESGIELPEAPSPNSSDSEEDLLLAPLVPPKAAVGLLDFSHHNGKEGMQPMLREAVAALEDAHLARKFGYVTFGSQDDQDRRLSLRYNIVLNIKNKQPYKDYFAAVPKLQREDGMPQTPPLDDLSISSRKWKYDIRQWDVQLKHWQKKQKKVPILPLHLAAKILAAGSAEMPDLEEDKEVFLKNFKVNADKEQLYGDLADLSDICRWSGAGMEALYPVAVNQTVTWQRR